MFDPELDRPEVAHIEHDTPGTSRRKKTKEVQDLCSALEKTSSASPDQGGDDEVEECLYYGSCRRYLPPHVNLTTIEYSGKQEETLMSWIITLEDISAQEDNLY
jgi:hypothetical protein